MRFIRKNGRVIPIKEAGVAGAAAAGAGFALSKASKLTAKAASYRKVANTTLTFQAGANNAAIMRKAIGFSKSAGRLKAVAGGLAAVSVAAVAALALKHRNSSGV